MFTGTRKQYCCTASQAVIKGMCDDGGLFVPQSFPELGFVSEFANKSYSEIAQIVFNLFLDDFAQDETELLSKRYGKSNFPDRIIDIRRLCGTRFPSLFDQTEIKSSSQERLAVLELFHGQTLAFKDMALSVLPTMMETALSKSDKSKKLRILVATSGDTGGATLYGFGKTNAQTIVLYPKNGVSLLQERQMLSLGLNRSADGRTYKQAQAYAFDGNFDDCQRLVKEVFSQNSRCRLNSDVLLSSANSINIGRLLPQIVYYVYTCAQLLKSGDIEWGEKVNFVVPTGNFGDILAGYIAKRMGAPIGKLVCASNRNNVLTDFFNSGTYDTNRQFFRTSSPAMDILVSSNLERLLYMFTDCSYVDGLMKEMKQTGKFAVSLDVIKQLRKHFLWECCDDNETLEQIRRRYKLNGYLIDPHTAVAFGCYYKVKSKLDGLTVVVSTASPYKFVSTVSGALGLSPCGEMQQIDLLSKATSTAVPRQIQILKDSRNKVETIDKEQLMKLLAQ